MSIRPHPCGPDGAVGAVVAVGVVAGGAVAVGAVTVWTTVCVRVLVTVLVFPPPHPAAATAPAATRSRDMARRRCARIGRTLAKQPLVQLGWVARDLEEALDALRRAEPEAPVEPVRVVGDEERPAQPLQLGVREHRLDQPDA